MRVPCGEGIYPRWGAKRPHRTDASVYQAIEGLLRSPAGINPLATGIYACPQGECAYSVFFLNPRKFIAHRQNCNTINA